MNKQTALKNLDKLFRNSPDNELKAEDNVVIFSDIHMGDGGKNDDFLKNAELFKFVLKNYYLHNNYKLFLNGDIEELYKFSEKQIIRKYEDIYDIFDEFRRYGNLVKIVGNHDHQLLISSVHPVNKNLEHGIRLRYKDDHIFLFHGHQTSGVFETYNLFSLFVVRYLARPLRIKNGSTPIDSKKISKTELRSYEFSTENKIISIIGHTHKPLFESLSKRDYLTYQIEKMCRKYPGAGGRKKRKIEENLKRFKDELKNLRKKEQYDNLRSTIYNDELLVPSLFNSGSAVGKRGITAIEISEGKISLVYWFDRNRSQRYLDYKGINTQQLYDTDYFKATLKIDTLDYIFTRIRLLA